MSTAAPNTSLVKPAEDKQAVVRDLLARAAPSMAAILPKHLTIERLTKIALSATARNPKLLLCNPISLVKAVMQGAELGLEAGGLLGEGYLVPYGKEIQFIPGYRGYAKLARQSGMLTSIAANVVHARDVFEVDLGLDQKLVHKPCLEGEPGPMVAVYAVMKFKDGGHQFDVMSTAAVERIRKFSKAANDGPWVEHFEEMAKKTVWRRMAKWSPLSTERDMKRALEHEAALESETRSPILDVAFFDTETGEITEEKPEPTRADGIKAKLAENGAAP